MNKLVLLIALVLVILAIKPLTVRVYKWFRFTENDTADELSNVEEELARRKKEKPKAKK